MIISSVSSAAPAMTVLNPVAASKPASGASSSAAVSTAPAKASASANSTSSSSSSSTAAPAKTSSGKGGGGGGGGAAVSTASSTAEEIAGSYSVTLGGKQYSGSVEESGGVYTASVGNLPGASASGSSAQAAEDNLTMRINELV